MLCSLYFVRLGVFVQSRARGGGGGSSVFPFSHAERRFARAGEVGLTRISAFFDDELPRMLRSSGENHTYYCRHESTYFFRVSPLPESSSFDPFKVKGPRVHEPNGLSSAPHLQLRVFLVG